MKRRKKEEIEEVEDTQEEELSEKELKKINLQKSADKRRNLKKKDKVARWGGIILLGLVMFVGFLLWVSGEMKQDSIIPNQENNLYRNRQIEVPVSSGTSSIIVR